jgi:hypothetical protein
MYTPDDMSRKDVSWAPDSVLGSRLMFDGFEPFRISVDTDEYVQKVGENLGSDKSEYRHMVVADGQTSYGSAREAISAASDSGISIKSLPYQDANPVETPVDGELAEPTREQTVAATFSNIEETLRKTSMSPGEYHHCGGQLTGTGSLREVADSLDGMPMGLRTGIRNEQGEKVAQIGYWRDGTFGWINSPLGDGELTPAEEAELDATVEEVTDRRAYD